MPNVRLKRHYSLIAHSPDTVELRHGVWNPTSVTLTDDTSKKVRFRAAAVYLRVTR